MTFFGILEVRGEKTRIRIPNSVVQIRGFVSVSKRGLNTIYTINKIIKIKFWHPKQQKRQDKEPDQNQYQKLYRSVNSKNDAHIILFPVFRIHDIFVWIQIWDQCL